VHVMHPLNFFGPEERAAIATGLKRLNAVPQISMESKMMDRQGNTIPVWLSASRFEVDGADYIAGIARDLRPLREQEALAQASYDQLEHIFNYASVGISYIDESGHWLRINPKLREILGYSQEELRHKTFADLTHPDDLARDLKQMDLVLKGQKQSYRLEKRFMHKEGYPVWCSLTVSAIFDEQGKPTHLMKIIENIDQKKKVEKRLRTTEELLNSAFNNMEDMVLITDPETRQIIDCNPAVERILGYSYGEIIG